MRFFKVSPKYGPFEAPTSGPQIRPLLKAIYLGKLAKYDDLLG